MDVLEELSKNLKPDWDFDESNRKIYTELCKLFSYDPRMQFLDILGTKGRTVKEDILNQEVDIKNVTNFDVSCVTFSKYFKQAQKELLGVDSIIEGDGHRYVLCESCRNYGTIKADATLGDLTRVKLGTETKGYRYLNIKEKYPYNKNDEFNLLRYIDNKINYIEFFYNSLVLMLLNGPSLSGCILERDFIGEEDRDKFVLNYLLDEIKYEEEAYLNIINTFDENHPIYLEMLKKHYEALIINSIFSESVSLQYKICIKIKDLFNKNYHFTNFVDATHVLNHLFLIAFSDNYSFFKLVNDDSCWQYAMVLKLEFAKKNIFLLLQPNAKGIYQLYFRDEGEIRNIISEYKGLNKNLIFKNS